MITPWMKLRLRFLVTFLIAFPSSVFAINVQSITSQIFTIDSFQLDNGITVITHERNDNDLFSIQLITDVGLQDFPCEDRHVPHALEHVLFEETKTYSGQALRDRVYDKGGYWQGYTSDEYTHYTVNIHKQFSDIAIDTLHRMISEPTLSDKATKNAIRTVNTEMGTTHSGGLQNWLNDTLSLAEQGKNRLYPKTNIACEKRQTPNHITSALVKDVFNQYYQPANFTIMVIGQFQKDTLAQLLNSTFGKLSPQKTSSRSPLALHEIDYTSITETEKYGDPSTYLRMFIRADGKSQSSHHTWQLISLYLTERMFLEIRTKRGIGYSPKASYKAGTDIGHLELYVRTTSDWFNEVEQITLDIYQDLITNGIPENDIHRLKNRMQYIFESRERNNQNLFQLYRHNRQWIKDHGHMKNLLDEMSVLTNEDIKATIQKLPKKPLIAVLRPNSLWEAIFKVIGIVAIAALIALPILKRSRNKKAHD